MSFSEDMFALLKRKDWQACDRRIAEAEPGATPEERRSIAHWRSAVLEWQGRYDEALHVLDASREDFLTQCGYRYQRAEILCRMDKFAEAIDTLRRAPFEGEITSFPAMAYEAIFLYCYLLKMNGRVPPRNLIALLPDDFTTRTYDGMRVSKADILPATSA